MGPVQVRFAILMHEAAHRLLFSNKRWNDWVGTWLVASRVRAYLHLPAGPFAHHKEEFGPNEPDMAFYRGYPCAPRTLARRLLRDAVGISGWKNFRVLLGGALRSDSGRRIASSIAWVSGPHGVASGLATGSLVDLPALWWAPWMTQWRVLKPVRAGSREHGGMRAGDDRRVTTHQVRQSWGARLWLVPYRTGWHLAHHVDMGMPRDLARFHAARAGGRRVRAPGAGGTELPGLVALHGVGVRLTAGTAALTSAPRLWHIARDDDPPDPLVLIA